VPDLTLPLSLPALVATAFLVSLATVAVPGPITLVASRLALSHRVNAVVFFLLGVTLVDVALFVALAAGAAPTLRRIGALPLVETIGGLALFWVGVASLREHRASRGSAPAGAVTEPRNVLAGFLLGVLTSLGNPHYWIWWVTAGLAFVEAARSHGRGGLLWMLGALVGGVVAWYIPLVWACRRGRALLSERGERIVTVSMGIVLLALGAGLTALGFHRLHWA
jgi:threonine/homoserine/homoserine lactone efflux protein